MSFSNTSWRPTQEEAVAIQRALKASVEIRPLPGRPRRIGGADVAYLRDGKACFAAWVVLDGPGGKVLDRAVVRKPVPFPYIPGLLAFREAPPLVHAFSRLRTPPDLAFVDGHGILHPRGLGLASHLGILLDLPTIGCAKGIAAEKRGFAELAAATRGRHAPLSLTAGNPEGVLLCTRDRHKPLCVSPGHRITLRESIEWTLLATGRYRMPEPLRQAHQLATRARNAVEKETGSSL